MNGAAIGIAVLALVVAVVAMVCCLGAAVKFAELARRVDALEAARTGTAALTAHAIARRGWWRTSTGKTLDAYQGGPPPDAGQDPGMQIRDGGGW